MQCDSQTDTCQEPLRHHHHRFIDMPAEDDRLKVIETLRSCVADDPIRTLVHGMTALGLVEVTRKRLTPSLEEQLKKVLDT